MEMEKKLINRKMKAAAFLGMLLVSIMWSCKKDSSLVEEESPLLVAEEAFIYGIPLVTMDITRRQATHTLEPVLGKMEAPLNQFSHLPIFPNSDFKSVVRPNADTFYSNAWLDLSKGPVSLSLPTDNERYHLLPMLDGYSNVIASPGTRTAGSKGGTYFITGPEWAGVVPTGAIHIQSPTDYVWIIGRTEVKSEQDGKEVVYPIMKQYTLTPPDGYKAPALEAEIPKGDPNSIVENMPIDEFFNYMNRAFVDNPPLAKDGPLVERMRKIGIGKGLEFKLADFTAEEQDALKRIPKNMIAKLNARQTEMPIVNGWAVLEDTGDYGTDYFHRAHVTRFGLGANLPEDAIYPTGILDADGAPFNGKNKYVITFEKGKLPPANAFWSLTMYNSSGFFVPNDLKRYTLGDRSDMLFNEDGSLDIYIQTEDPGGDKTKNWLPADAEHFSLTLRVYYPKEEMLNGTWKAPAVRKVE